FFIPMIMDSGGNVGTQSLAVSVRGLALGTLEKNNFWRMIRKEFSTGALIGLICMILILAIVYIMFGNAALGLVVGISILCTLTFSAVIGAVIPLIINKLKIDPAIASGQFATTFNDVIGLLFCFTIDTYVMDFLVSEILNIEYKGQLILASVSFFQTKHDQTVILCAVLFF